MKFVKPLSSPVETPIETLQAPGSPCYLWKNPLRLFPNPSHSLFCFKLLPTAGSKFFRAQDVVEESLAGGGQQSFALCSSSAEELYEGAQELKVGFTGGVDIYPGSLNL